MIACARLRRSSDNRVENGFFGIYLADVTDCRDRRQRPPGRAHARDRGGQRHSSLDVRRITIDGNDISGHRDGIYFEFVHDSDVRGNVSTDNLRYGLHFMYSDDCRYVENTFRHNGSGVAVMYTKSVEMTGNRFEDNWGAAAYGLLLKEISDARLERQRVRAQHGGAARRRRQPHRGDRQRLHRQRLGGPPRCEHRGRPLRAEQLRRQQLRRRHQQPVALDDFRRQLLGRLSRLRPGSRRSRRRSASSGTALLRDRRARPAVAHSHAEHVHHAARRRRTRVAVAHAGRACRRDASHEAVAFGMLR